MTVIELENKLYPKILKNIKKAPKKLYINGNLDILNSNCIAIIGSRKNTKYGEKWCKKFAQEFIKYNLTIVSGMALGIDKIAHKTAIRNGGKTIAVLPSGLENIYPEENLELYNEIILNGGCVISEYEPKINASSKNFLERNRIVSGLSLGTVVIEAAYRSGTSVTAKIAKEQGRDVFCIPGSLDNPKSIGTNNLIKEFAKIVTSPKDVINNYNFLHKIEVNSNTLVKEQIPEEYKKIYSLITDIPININDIAKKSLLELREVSSKLTMLELDGKVVKLPGNMYIRGDLD
ncbi:MAG: DNA-processing protein DprA [Clostridia bacterium]